MTVPRRDPETVVIKDPSQRDTEEMCLIGSMMLSPDIVPEVDIHIKPEHFKNDLLRAVYRAILRCLNSGDKLDIVLLAEHAVKIKLLRDIAPILIAQCMDEVPTSSNALWYAKRLLEHFAQDMLRDEVKGIARTVCEDFDHRDVLESIKAIEEKLPFIPTEEERMTDVLADFIDDIKDPKRAIKKYGTRIVTGIEVLDEQIPDLGAGKVCVVGGRTSHGKSIFAVNVAMETLKRDMPVVIHTYELPKRTYLERMSSMMLEIPIGRISRPELLSEDERKKLLSIEHFLELCTSNLHIYEHPGEEEVFSKIIQHRPKLVVIDYLQAWVYQGDLQKTMDQQHRTKIGAYMAKLKKFSEKYKCCIVVCSQMHRTKPDKDGDIPRPRMQQALEGASIENHADYFIIPYWPEKDRTIAGKDEFERVKMILDERCPERDIRPQDAYYELIIDKNRNGALGTIPCTIIPHCMKILANEDHAQI